MQITPEAGTPRATPTARWIKSLERAVARLEALQNDAQGGAAREPVSYAKDAALRALRNAERARAQSVR